MSHQRSPTAQGSEITTGGQDLQTVKNDLLASGFYLGETSVLANVVWKRINRSDHLVTKESAELYEKAIAATRPTTTDVKGKQNEGTSQAIHVEGLPIPELEPAILYAVITISPDDCFLTPCGNWKGPTPATQHFEDVKLSFCGNASSDNVFGKDFRATTSNAKSLMQQIAVANTINKGLVVVTRGVENLRFRHVVFEVCHPYVAERRND
jgi:hypothetical protein